ncbi:hypothetical protein NUM3379_15750 [Kineococcus sp. NUM-3379]
MEGTVVAEAAGGAQAPAPTASAGRACRATGAEAALCRRMWWRRHSTSYSTGGLGGVGVHVPDDDLLALDDHLPVHGARVVGGAGPAPAQRGDLEDLHPVRELHEPGRAGEEARAEVRGDPEGEHVDVVVVHEVGELLHLLGGVELRLVAHDVVDALAAGRARRQLGEEVGAVVDLGGVAAQPEAAGDHGVAGAVEAGEQQPAAAPGGVVVVHLQREGRLAAVHRPREEHQLRHGRHPAAAAAAGPSRRACRSVRCRVEKSVSAGRGGCAGGSGSSQNGTSPLTVGYLTCR